MEGFAVLALLACPVGMGLMMWFMARGQRQDKAEPKDMSLTELKAEQRRLDAELIADELARRDRRAMAGERARM